MRIIILGAGQVGTSVAEALASESQNEITLVDANASVLQAVQERTDLRTVVGHASHPAVLRAAGADDAEMLIAVTNSDEVNMAACEVANALFHTPTKIARIRAPEYLAYQAELFRRDAVAIDTVISPEKLVTEYIERLIDYPGALQVLDFAKGRVRLVVVRAVYGSPLVGAEVRRLREHLPGIDARVVAIYRRGRATTPKGSSVIDEDDEVFVIAAAQDMHAVMAEFRPHDKPAKSLFLAGGGNIGKRLALNLEQRCRVKILERNPQRSEALTRDLRHTIVLRGDITDSQALSDEKVEYSDVFCALTNDDEANILSAMLAKDLGARKVMAIINRAAYVSLMHAGLIDIVISPQQTTIGSVLARVRRGDMLVVHSLRRGMAEAIELVAHGNKSSSAVVGRTVEQVSLPRDTTISTIVRGEKVIMAHHNTLIESGDHVILFLANKRQISEIERLFAVSAVLA